MTHTCECKRRKQTSTLDRIVSKHSLLEETFNCLFNWMLGAYCLNPPSPPANHNLSLSIDPSQLIEIGADIRYDCVAGGHNRIRRNYGNNSFSLKCEEDNVIEEPTEWPSCVPGSNSWNKIFLMSGN